jgi:hypothetical protein
MGLGTFGASVPLFLRNRELLGHSPMRNVENHPCNISTMFGSNWACG